MKRNLFFSIVFAFISLPFLSAQEWDGESTQTPLLTGDTYHITTGAELAWLAQQSKTNDFAGMTFVLDNDIDLGDGHNWTPIGGGGVDFQGTFDGQCHTIKRLFISYVPRNTDIGLFGAVGTNGNVRNIAVESGKIFVSEINNVGCIAGRNEGNVDHTFGMIQILADASDNVGGLIGCNNGTLTYSYQAGYISDAGNNSGGLTGVNNGTVSHCYCSGYTMSSGANCGSVVGINNGTFSDTYFDQQMCLQKASTKDETGVTAVTLTNDMYNIFSGDSEWRTTNMSGEKAYPQLECFASTSPDASHVSALMIFLPTNEAPIQRAENITVNFSLSCIYDGSKWTSPDENLIKIGGSFEMRTFATITRPCSNRVIVITSQINDSYRGYLLQVTGFKTFNAGVIGGYHRACHGDPVKFSDKIDGAEVIDAVGGRDDDKEAYPYYYRIEQYQLLDNDNDGQYEDTVLFKSYTMISADYKDWLCDTEHDGHWVYRRYAHDSQCQLDYKRSTGEYYLTVFSGFDAGKIETKTDTIYGEYPTTIHVNSDIDANGGEGPYLYQWYRTKLDINYLTGDTAVVADSALIQKETEGAVATLDTTIDAVGEYLFYRAARDMYCSKNWHTPSEGVRHFVIFDYLNAGAINADTINICLGDALPDITESIAPSGGNGIYSFRWLINGQVIEDADSSALVINDTPEETGVTYKIVRQVKDNTGLMDWTNSEGTFVIHVNRSLDAGEILSEDRNYCLLWNDSLNRVEIEVDNFISASGDGEINYRWQIYNSENDQLLQTINQNSENLSDSITLNIGLPAYIYIKRQCQSQICSDSWIDSEGIAKLSIGKDEIREENISICRNQLPYDGIYEFSNGETQKYHFDSKYDTETIIGFSEIGCAEDVELRCKIKETPEIFAHWGDTLLCTHSYYGSDYLWYCCHIDYINRLHNNNCDFEYNITFNPAAYNAGFQDISGIFNKDTIQHMYNDSMYYLHGDIDIEIGNVPIGEYVMYIQIKEHDFAESCLDYIDTIPFRVQLGGYIHQKWNDVLYIDNNDKNGYPRAENDLKFSGYQWYKDGEPISGATGQVYVEQGGLNGEYYAILTDTAGNEYQTCPYEVRPTALSNQENALYIYPTILNPNEKINILSPQDGHISIISIDGKIYHTFADSDTLTAPAVSGIYLIRLTTNSGQIYHSRIIVK